MRQFSLIKIYNKTITPIIIKIRGNNNNNSQITTNIKKIKKYKIKCSLNQLMLKIHNI